MTHSTSRPRRLLDAYTVGITLVEELHHESLCTALETTDGPFETLTDGYSTWHPALHLFDGMLRLFLYREITGCSYRDLTRYPELADAFGLDSIPDVSVLSRAW